MPAIGCRSNVDLIDFSVTARNVFCRYAKPSRAATDVDVDVCEDDEGHVYAEGCYPSS